MLLAYHEMGSFGVDFFFHAIEPMEHAVRFKRGTGRKDRYSTHLVYLMAR